jgi:hypothetical protein
MANKFTLKGHQIEVESTIGGNPTFPSLKYKRGPVSKSFTSSEIHTDNTALGSLVSVALVKTIDTGAELFAFFLPQLDVPKGQTAHFTAAPSSLMPDLFHQTPSAEVSVALLFWTMIAIVAYAGILAPWWRSAPPHRKHAVAARLGRLHTAGPAALTLDPCGNHRS